MIIHSFKNFIIRSFKKSTQRPPSPVTAIQISLKQPANRIFVAFRQEADFKRESSPGGGTTNEECTTLLNCNNCVTSLLIQCTKLLHYFDFEFGCNFVKPVC